MAPMRNSTGDDGSSGASASLAYSEQMASARFSVVCPAAFSVADLPVRSNRWNPSSSSSRLIWLLTADCVKPMRSPAAAKVPCLQTAMNVLSSVITVQPVRPRSVKWLGGGFDYPGAQARRVHIAPAFDCVATWPQAHPAHRLSPK
jgi:hypothetical protein